MNPQGDDRWTGARDARRTAGQTGTGVEEGFLKFGLCLGPCPTNFSFSVSLPLSLLLFVFFCLLSASVFLRLFLFRGTLFLWLSHLGHCFLLGVILSIALSVLLPLPVSDLAPL